tara:strand:- start:1158 stop:1403 length:246 start_codon:yes stop_codon:yes gene_type:complete
MEESNDPVIKALQEGKYFLIDKKQPWFTHHYNMSGLARAMVDSGHIPNLDIMLEYIEKPWKWTDAWEHYREHDNTENYGDE